MSVRMLGWVVVGVLLAAGCGQGDAVTGGEFGSSQAGVEPSQLESDLLSVLRGAAAGAAVRGTAEIETPLEGLPVDVPGRTYALVQVMVSEVVGRQGTVTPGGNPLPAMTAGEVVPLVAYHDLANTPLGEMQRLQESGDEVLFLLAGIGNAADPGWQGMWLLKRVVEMVDDRPTVRGLCEDQVNAAMSQVAAAVGRPLD